MRISAIIVLLICCLQSCGLREREMKLDAKAKEVNEKEQQLILKEKALELKEQELMAFQKKLDSTGIELPRDTVAVNPDFLGSWQVKMSCIETNCQGSAVGDTKNEHWLIEQQASGIIAKALTGDQLVRAYTGRFNGSFLVLTSTQEDENQKIQSRMNVRLQRVDKNMLEGQREITRPGECRIVYELQLKRTEK